MLQVLQVMHSGTLKSGIETVLDLLDFDRRLEGVDVVVTGEGQREKLAVKFHVCLPSLHASYKNA